MKPEHTHTEHLRALLVKRSVQTGKTFTLASGKKSDFYFDARQVTLSSEGQGLIGAVGHNFVMATLGAGSIVAIGGLEVGAIPMATAISFMSHFSTNGQLDAFYVRKKAKGHGTKKLVEGLDRHAGTSVKVAVIEDVTTTGGSAIKAVKAVREAGFICDTVFTLVDREEGGREAIEAEGCKLFPFFTRSDLLG